MPIFAARRFRRSLDRLEAVHRSVLGSLAALRASGVHDPDRDAALMFVSTWLEHTARDLRTEMLTRPTNR